MLEFTHLFENLFAQSYRLTGYNAAQPSPLGGDFYRQRRSSQSSDNRIANEQRGFLERLCMTK
jgi:hypothetical protein